MSEHTILISQLLDSRDAFPSEAVLLDKAHELFLSSPTQPSALATFEFDRPEQIAVDAVGVLRSFDSVRGELAKVDSANPGQQWEARWNQLLTNYNGLLSESARIALKGSSYIDDFNTQIVGHFSQDSVNWEQDKTMIADFIKNQQGDQQMANVHELSQSFTNLRGDVEVFKHNYSSFATNQGSKFDANLSALHRNMDNLQAQIAKHQSTEAQIERALRQLVGPGFLTGLFISELLGALGIKSADEARRVLDQTYREESNLRRQKDAVQRQADEVARQGSILKQVRHALDVLARDVTDITGRLNRFAGSWAVSQRDVVALGEHLKNAATTASRSAFKRRLTLFSKSAEAADMRVYIDGLVSAGIIPPPPIQGSALVISSQFGGSDTSNGSTFNDANAIGDIDRMFAISKITVQSGWVVDGIEIVYRLQGGRTHFVTHGTVTRSSERQVSQLTLNDTEYINAVYGKSGFANNGYPFMGDCIQQIQFEVTNAMSGSKRTFGPLGEARDLSPSANRPIKWSGRLHAFAGRANDSAGQVGLRGIAFVEYKG